MSGLLVKSTIIMRENLEELNTRGLADACRCSSAAPRSRATTSSATCASVYDGRVFYGKDAFEGLRTMDTLMEGKRTGTLDPDVRARARRARAAAPQDANAKPRATATASTKRRRHPLRRRDRRPDLHAAVRRLARREGHLARRHRRLRQRDRAVPQPVAVPAREERAAPRPTTSSRRASGPTLREQLGKAQAGGAARPRGRVGLLRGQQRRQRPRRVEGRHRRTQEWLRFSFPRQRKAPFLCIADFFRPAESGEPDYAAFHVVTMGAAASASASRSCSRPTSTRTTCCCTASRSR